MHWWTWGADDAIYLIEGDGGNFGGKGSYATLLKVTGMPPAHKVEVVTTFGEVRLRERIGDMKVRRYLCAPLAIGKRLYVSVYDYDWDIPGRRPHENKTDFEIVDRMSKHKGIAGIMHSDDGGKTWENVPERDTPYLLGPRFAGMQFLNFGPGYTGVPKELGDFVYAVGNDGYWENGDNVFLARVMRDSVQRRGAWEFFGGGGKWVKDENASAPVLSDPGHVSHPSITYVPALRRYLLVTFSDVKEHNWETPLETMKAEWDVRTELQMYEGEQPWGPWRLVHDERPWGGEGHAAYLAHVPGKWMSEDGLSGTLMYSGDWAYAPYKGAWYGLVTQGFRLKRR
jgi:hypothetical protein